MDFIWYHFFWGGGAGLKGGWTQDTKEHARGKRLNQLQRERELLENSGHTSWLYSFANWSVQAPQSDQKTLHDNDISDIKSNGDNDDEAHDNKCNDNRNNSNVLLFIDYEYGHLSSTTFHIMYGVVARYINVCSIVLKPMNIAKYADGE